MGLNLFAAHAAWLTCFALPAGVVPAPASPIVAGMDTAGNAVKLFDGSGGTPFDFSPFDAGYTGGVRVASGDVNGDGAADIVVAAGPGGTSNVRVFDGADGSLLRNFVAYAGGFTGGVYVGTGDVDGDGRADIITGSGPAVSSSAHVKVFSGATGAEIRSFFAFPGFAGGVTVAAGDVNGDGRADLIAGASSAAPAHVRVFDGRTGAELRSFFAYDLGFTGGVFVAGGDVNGDGRDDIVTGAGAGGAPHVKVFDGATLAPLASFFAYGAGFTGGVRVAAGDIDGDGRADIVTGPGAGTNPLVSRFMGPAATTGGSFLAFDNSYTGGVFVAGVLAPIDPRVFRDGFESPIVR